MSKSVDEKTFKECCDMMLAGRMHPDVAAYLCGLSRPTFNLRVNQYYDPERYGELPEDFFTGKPKKKWKENQWWTKNSVAIKRYLEKEEEKKRREIAKQEHLKALKEKDTFKPAYKLPDLKGGKKK